MTSATIFPTKFFNKNAHETLNILFLHGGWQRGETWERVATLLTDAGHHVWTPTFLGCQDHDPLCATVTLQEMVDDVVKLIHSDEGMQNLVLVTQSGSGPVGQLIAAAVPDRVEQVIFCDSWALRGDESILEALAAASGDASEGTKALQELARQGNPLPMSPELWWTQFAQDADEKTKAEMWPIMEGSPCPPHQMVDIADWQAFWDAREKKNFEIGYIFFAEDIAVPEAIYWQMAQRLHPGITARTPGSHQGWWMHPQEFAQTLINVIHSLRQLAELDQLVTGAK